MNKFIISGIIIIVIFAGGFMAGLNFVKTGDPEIVEKSDVISDPVVRN